jgi:hypothetical protein
MRTLYTEKILQGIHNNLGQDKNTDQAYLSAERLHGFIIAGDNEVGNAVGSTFIFPTTVEQPRINRLWSVEYRMMDGGLYYGVNRMDAIVSAEAKNRQRAKVPIFPQSNAITLSPAGRHSNLIRTVTYNPSGDLVLRTVVEESNKKIELDCRDLQIGLLGMSFATPCPHSVRLPLEKSLHSLVRTTSISAPVAWGRKIAIVMTQSDHEAQFLSLTGRARALYQGDCCLNCAVQEAERDGFDCIIVV